MPVLQFCIPSENRKKFIFTNRPVEIATENVKFPCICLCEKETNLLVSTPGFERWYLNLSEVQAMATMTLQKRAYTICSFLNFWLWNTNCDRISELTLNDIRNFLIDYKKINADTERDLDSWNRGISEVFNFLIRYYEYNKEKMEFSYRTEELCSVGVVRDSGTGRKSIVRKYNKFSVKPPAKHQKKNRLLVYGYLDFILEEAKKHDPMIVLGIALQAYAGLREGEIVNITRRNIHMTYAGFGRIGKICVDITRQAPFSQDGKSTFGNIKVLRNQEVYSDFVPIIQRIYEQHMNLLTLMDVPADPDAPLFLNKWRKPLSSNTYRVRVQKLFQEHFLPDLQRYCEENGTWAENAPYIQAYQEEYPGAHMFRHWFTMYLVTKTNLSTEEIAKWRGDSSMESMMSYIHVNADMLALYKDSAYRFQRSIWAEVCVNG